MSHPQNLGIGGLNLRLDSESDLSFEYSHERYRAFYGCIADGPDPLDVNVRIRVPDLPDMLAHRKIFDSVESWTMFAEALDRWAVLGPPSCPKDLWCVHLKLGSRDVTIYCGKDLVRETDGRRVVLDPVNYPLDLVLIMYLLAPVMGGIVHAAGIEVDGKALVFPGPSGSGKSTLARLALPDKRVSVLSDDRIILRKGGSGFTAYGTPWLGEAELAENRCAPLRALLFPEHGDEAVSKLSSGEALERLLPVVSVPWYDEPVAHQVLAFCESLVALVPVYRFCFRPDSDVTRLVEACLSGL